MSAPTPGTWAVSFEVTRIDIHAEGVRIATIPRYEPAYKTDRANARLIASAPDLLAALLKCLPFIDDSRDVYQIFPEVAAGAECREAIREARAALAKATGEPT